jgi:hypothetical protein
MFDRDPSGTIIGDKPDTCSFHGYPTPFLLLLNSGFQRTIGALLHTSFAW